MARMWRGPTPEMQRAHNDPLFTWIIRRCGKLNVQIKMALDGRQAEVGRLETPGGRCGTVFWNKIDVAQGCDPWATALHIALAHTPLDAELVAQYGRYLDREIEDIRKAVGRVVKLDVEVEDLIASVRA
jgi:hypothetical protein